MASAFSALLAHLGMSGSGTSEAFAILALALAESFAAFILTLLSAAACFFEAFPSATFALDLAISSSTFLVSSSTLFLSESMCALAYIASYLISSAALRFSSEISASILLRSCAIES